MRGAGPDQRNLGSDNCSFRVGVRGHLWCRRVELKICTFLKQETFTKGITCN